MAHSSRSWEGSTLMLTTLPPSALTWWWARRVGRRSTLGRVLQESGCCISPTLSLAERPRSLWRCVGWSNGGMCTFSYTVTHSLTHSLSLLTYPLSLALLPQPPSHTHSASFPGILSTWERGYHPPSHTTPPLLTLPHHLPHHTTPPSHTSLPPTPPIPPSQEEPHEWGVRAPGTEIHPLEAAPRKWRQLLREKMVNECTPAK